VRTRRFVSSALVAATAAALLAIGAGTAVAQGDPAAGRTSSGFAAQPGAAARVGVDLDNREWQIVAP